MIRISGSKLPNETFLRSIFSNTTKCPSKFSDIGKKKLSNNVHNQPERLKSILERLSKVDTAALCDAEKSILQNVSPLYEQLKVMAPSVKPRNLPDVQQNGTGSTQLLGVARTIQFNEKNDFLAMIRGLDEGECGEVLVVNTLNSNRAVAGGLFVTEAMRKNLSGIIVDGPIRDIETIKTANLLCFSTSITPYSGTVQSIGETQVPINCGDVEVLPGEIIMGDADGVIVGPIDTFESIIDSAENIVQVESKLMERMQQGHSLVSMTNYKEHFKARKEGEDSVLEFR